MTSWVWPAAAVAAIAIAAWAYGAREERVAGRAGPAALRTLVVFLVLAGLAACEFPTEPPRWDTTWQVPVEAIRVRATDLLPASVDVNADTSAFVTETPEASIRVALSDLCEVCLLLDGVRTAKPAFTDTQSTSTSLPSELVSATLAGGSFDLVMGHSFNFDPLRPSATANGHIVIRITSAGNVVAEDSIDGADTAFPTGTTLS
ncbi:MAG: hypothetical protein R3266_06710, partial [Gemmatimonadota bacterium]|nr:hypothetical protein [Gemmatimonadota bacterium]